jgi:hypothetical protein
VTTQETKEESDPMNFELDGIEGYQLTGGWLQISGPGDAVLISPTVARALRDWLNKVLP